MINEETQTGHSVTLRISVKKISVSEGGKCLNLLTLSSKKTIIFKSLNLKIDLGTLHTHPDERKQYKNSRIVTYFEEIIFPRVFIYSGRMNSGPFRSKLVQTKIDCCI